MRLRSGKAVCGLRMQEQPGGDGPEPPRRIGASIDADGKSNIWAVEPKMQVDESGSGLQTIGIIFGVVATLLG
eukprot:CAMPEP_0184293506 /NCGR_PEP_ID=MMETSP1049-20130417/4918_1 /TAXON_ID=77928 /ORGANISM="Proteomonas sulcata, Strain CCMP704" /LENGTH=72 /DNA_ID=CAMNT_0026601495 /DNA_START=17 /DNA_END=232 /DNA_ORIENTATION=-